MASKEECDRYAAELTQRFEDLAKWAITNWPKKDFPLLRSDFSESSREISGIVGAKLGDAGSDNAGPGRPRGSGQYVGMNPMPWP
jgi:hypothetical protein